MFIKEIDRISRRKTVDGRVKEFRISDDIVYEFLDIAVVGDVAAALAGDVHLPARFRIGVEQQYFMVLIRAVQCEKQAGSPGTDADDRFLVIVVAHFCSNYNPGD